MIRIRRTRGGVAGLEFALLSPILLVLLLGTIDLSGALITARRMEAVAGSVVEIGTTAAAQTQALNMLTGAQAWQATTAPFALFPGWTGRTASKTFAITLSAVAFTPTQAGCTEGCSYTANVVWSVANELGTPTLRACGKLQSVPNENATSYATLPVGNFGPTAVLVADIAYTYQPTFFGFLIGNIPMMQSAYLSPRIDNGIALSDTSGAGVSVNCESPS
ncbi:TadE/TadG family type IV pilus assembly protein [Rhodopila sp.]|uniref:TadE/TadG family type IV pilus assembly protein n=1 Tax=Rhodopila sp. TaxID=2480087 RepID=UPI003D128E55